MKVKESILQEIDNYIDGRIDELSDLAKKYAEIDNYAETGYDSYQLIKISEEGNI